jgi:aryl sulfotransferase
MTDAANETGAPSARLRNLPLRTREDFDAWVRAPFDERGLALMRMELAPSDVVIATFPKSGTTWAQQICHGLRSRGDMDFEEITFAVPWIERGHLFGIDASAPQRFAPPRMFKTHLEYTNLGKGARALHVIRDPKDVLVSYYRFLSHAIIDPAAISIDVFADVWLFSDLVAERGSADGPPGPNLYNYWRHLIDWWQARDHAPVLTLAYENLQRDLPGHVARIAEFVGIDAGRALLDLATRQATFEFMAAHRTQFSDRIPETQIRFAKVVDGAVGAHRAHVSPALAARIDDAWRRYVTPVLDCASYEALVQTLSW